VLPEWTDAGLWNIPGSMIYFPMHGLRRCIPLRFRVRRAIKGLDAAVQRKRVFHLWFHPTNLATESETMFRGLRSVLDHGRRLCRRGDLVLRTMAALAQPDQQISRERVSVHSP
jgi:hypothetical protein